MGYIELTDDSLMPMGKHKGKRLSEVPDSYFEWWLTTNTKGNLRDYARMRLGLPSERQGDEFKQELREGVYEQVCKYALGILTFPQLSALKSYWRERGITIKGTTFDNFIVEATETSNNTDEIPF